MTLLHRFIRMYKYLLNIIAISATYSFETNSSHSGSNEEIGSPNIAMQDDQSSRTLETL